MEWIYILHAKQVQMPTSEPDGSAFVLLMLLGGSCWFRSTQHYLYCWADLIDNTEQILPIPFRGSYWLCWADVIDPSERILLIPLSGTYLSDVRIIPTPLRGSYWLCWANRTDTTERNIPLSPEGKCLSTPDGVQLILFDLNYSV